MDVVHLRDVEFKFTFLINDLNFVFGLHKFFSVIAAATN